METKASRLRITTDTAISERDAMNAAKDLADVNKCISCIDKAMENAAKNCLNKVFIAFLPKGSYLNKKKVNADKMYLVNENEIKGRVFQRKTEEDRLCVPRNRRKFIGQYAHPETVYKKLKDEKLHVEWFTHEGTKRNEFYIESSFRGYHTEIFYMSIWW